ncbi:Trihelix transcription factor GT-3b [Ancistrocladus abbreviatus]
MEGHVHHRQQQQQQVMMMGSLDAGDRFPQWSSQETKEFLMIRAELDRSFMETKRNKVLWEVISTKMKEKGFNRSAEQCKCKWKNLVTRYKGCETMEPEAMRQQFPFYNEMQAIFTARMQQMLWAEEAEGAPSGSKKKAVAQLSSDDEDDEDTDDGGGEQKISTTIRKKRKARVGAGGGGSSSGNANSLKEMLEGFLKQQLQMELQWREAWEAREDERRRMEMEWRQAMEALEQERLMMERRWREREEQRRVRDEARAERRDVLVTALLERLRREQDM